MNFFYLIRKVALVLLALLSLFFCSLVMADHLHLLFYILVNYNFFQPLNYLFTSNVQAPFFLCFYKTIELSLFNEVVFLQQHFHERFFPQRQEYSLILLWDWWVSIIFSSTKKEWQKYYLLYVSAVRNLFFLVEIMEEGHITVQSIHKFYIMWYYCTLILLLGTCHICSFLCWLCF